VEAHLALNEKVTEARQLPVLERKLKFHPCFPRTNALDPISGKKHLDRWILGHENCPTNDAAKGSNFLVAVVVAVAAIKRQKAATRQVYSKILHTFHAPPYSLSSE